MAAGDITIKNTNTKATYTNSLWQTGLTAATTDDSLQTKNNPALVIPDVNGKVKFRFWELDQFAVLSAYNGTADVTGTGADDGNVIVIGAPATEAEKAYYKGLNGVSGITITIAS